MHRGSALQIIKIYMKWSFSALGCCNTLGRYTQVGVPFTVRTASFDNTDNNTIVFYFVIGLIFQVVFNLSVEGHWAG